MANKMSEDEKFMNQGAQVELNSENKRIQTVEVGPKTDSFDTKLSDQTANIPESEDSENDRIKTAYPEDTSTTTTTTAGTTTTTTTV